MTGHNSGPAVDGHGPRILVPIVDPNLVAPPLTHALNAYPDAEITVLYIREGTGENDRTPDEPGENDRSTESDRAPAEQLAALRAVVRDQAAEFDTTVETEVAVGKPVAIILTRTETVDLIVIGGPAGRWSARGGQGTIAAVLVRHSPVPVTVVQA